MKRLENSNTKYSQLNQLTETYSNILHKNESKINKSVVITNSKKLSFHYIPISQFTHAKKKRYFLKQKEIIEQETPTKDIIIEDIFSRENSNESITSRKDNSKVSEDKDLVSEDNNSFVKIYKDDINIDDTSQQNNQKIIDNNNNNKRKISYIQNTSAQNFDNVSQKTKNDSKTSLNKENNSKYVETKKPQNDNLSVNNSKYGYHQYPYSLGKTQKQIIKRKNSDKRIKLLQKTVFGNKRTKLCNLDDQISLEEKNGQENLTINTQMRIGNFKDLKLSNMRKWTKNGNSHNIEAVNNSNIKMNNNNNNTKIKGEYIDSVNNSSLQKHYRNINDNLRSEVPKYRKLVQSLVNSKNNNGYFSSQSNRNSIYINTETKNIQQQCYRYLNGESNEKEKYLKSLSKNRIENNNSIISKENNSHNIKNYNNNNNNNNNSIKPSPIKNQNINLAPKKIVRNLKI